MIGRTEDTGMAGMLEDAKVEGFLVRLDAPGDGMVGLDIDPSDEVGLSGRIHISMCDRTRPVDFFYCMYRNEKETLIDT